METMPTWLALVHPVEGAAPPDVLTRWMNVVSASA